MWGAEPMFNTHIARKGGPGGGRGWGLVSVQQEGPRSAWKPAGFRGPNWAGEMLAVLSPVRLRVPGPCGSLQAWEPLPSSSHHSGAQVLSGLHFSSPSLPPTFYSVTRGFLPSPWVLWYPTSVWQVP